MKKHKTVEEIYEIIQELTVREKKELIEKLVYEMEWK